MTGAQLTHEQKPLYPENLLKTQKQGNVLLIGRIDAAGKLQGLQPVTATHELFIEPAVAAARAWQFRPAMRDGKPIEIAANVGMRFRINSEKRGELPRPILGDLAVFPANAAGEKRAPEGFPIRRGADPKLRVEAVLDVTPGPQTRTVAVRSDAVSQKGRGFKLFEKTLRVPAKATEIQVFFSAPVGADWEDGVWAIQFNVDRIPAGGGQFWLAGDPSRFDFAAAMTKK